MMTMGYRHTLYAQIVPSGIQLLQTAAQRMTFSLHAGNNA